MSPLAASVDNLAATMSKVLGPYPRLKNTLKIPWGQVRRVRDYGTRLRADRVQRQCAARIETIERAVRRHEVRVRTPGAPVIFFNASAHTEQVTFVSLAWLVTSWGLRMGGHRVLNYVCRRGLAPCVIGSIDRYTEAGPPCEACQATNRRIFDPQATIAFDPPSEGGPRLWPSLQSISLAELQDYCYHDLPLGRLALPSVRWALRRFSLADDEPTRRLYARYIASAADLAESFEPYLDRVQPRAVVAFNGTFYPEAVATHLARSRDIPTVTFEVGFRRHSVFFSHGLATEYAVDIPADFQLTRAQSQEFAAYLERRFAGECYMGGTNYWNEITGLSDELAAKVRRFRQVVPLFTNVAFDTSQVSANSIFASMFEWMDQTLVAARRYPDTLFIVRAHPAEARPSKTSAEPVGGWLAERGFLAQENVAFIPPSQPTSSYELIRLAGFCLVYNSTIGLESVILGKPVICAGLPKYMSQGVAHLPETKAGYFGLLERYLTGPGAETSPQEREQAVRYFYYLIFKSSLDFSAYIHEPLTGHGYALKPFEPDDLRPDRSEVVGVIREGILGGGSFCH